MLLLPVMIQPDTLINQRYRIVQMVGAGGMGSVYAAQDERLGRVVALKLLRADLAADQRARERFLREAQIAAQLIHPHIVRTYDVGEAPEGPYLIQELLEGHTLDTVLPLPPEQAIAVIDAVADALGYIHQHGYVHCDIKPQNMMLLGHGSNLRVVLLDFGIARVAGTDTTTLIATPHYVAPERILGSAPTPASDLYALGIVLYQTLTGQPPFDAPNMHAIIEQHRSAPLPPLNLHAANTAALETIVRKLTAKQPEQRYASAAALRHDLGALNSAPPHAQPTIVVAAAQRQDNLTPARSAAAALPLTNHKRIGSGYLWAPVLFAVFLLAGFAIQQRTAGADDALLNPIPSAPAVAAPSAAPTRAPMATVPDVIGLPVDQAQQQIEAAGLMFVAGEAVASDQPPNTVVNTDPGPYQPLDPGSPVSVQTSGGPPVVAPVQSGNDGDIEDKKKDDKPGSKDEKDKDNGKGRNNDD